jgi:predicted metal-dependent enzyme (double-stranded beta helix superfamily)
MPAATSACWTMMSSLVYAMGGTKPAWSQASRNSRRQFSQPAIQARLGRPDRVAGHLLHAEPDGAFSILGLVWRPWQTTRIHDHITWCVVGVLSGIEHEELFDEALNPIGTRDNPPGEVSGFAPPGDIHRIRNVGDETAISLHIYGTDITRVGSSARRYYN